MDLPTGRYDLVAMAVMMPILGQGFFFGNSLPELFIFLLELLQLPELVRPQSRFFQMRAVQYCTDGSLVPT